jgi:hypothetical protein
MTELFFEDWDALHHEDGLEHLLGLDFNEKGIIALALLAITANKFILIVDVDR